MNKTNQNKQNSRYQEILLSLRKTIKLYKNNKENSEDNFVTKHAEELEEKVIRLSLLDDILLNIKDISTLVDSYINIDIVNEAYQKILNDYKRVLNKYFLLAKELRLTNSLELCNLFSYLLWNGYLSVTRQHCYKSSDRLQLDGLYSFDVLKGGGVCLNYADLLKDFLNVTDNKASLLFGSYKRNKLKYSCSPKVRRKVEESTKSSSKMSVFLSKFETVYHAVTLVKDKENFYIYDPTNWALFDILDEKKAKIVNGSGLMRLDPLSTLLFYPTNDQNCLFECLENNQVSNFNRREFIYSIDDTLERLKENRKLILDCYNSVYPHLENIVNTTEQIGSPVKILNRK